MSSPKDDVIGIRGPLGNHFPMEDFVGKDIVVCGGGIGGAPLRPVIEYILQRREDFGKLTILWAARTPDLLLFKEDYDTWRIPLILNCISPWTRETKIGKAMLA